MTEMNLKKRLSKSMIIGDGAMGTMLYQHGFFGNTCFDELNLTRPELIESIHREYLETGCDVIETNSFGANSFKLARFGLADEQDAINLAAAELARGASGEEHLVAGAIGPTGKNNPAPGKELKQQLSVAFTTQSKALAKGGVDFLLLETFTSTAELAIAIEAAMETGLPIVAQMTCTEQLETFFGTRIEKAIAEIARYDAVAADRRYTTEL